MIHTNFTTTFMEVILYIISLLPSITSFTARTGDKKTAGEGARRS